MPGYELLVAFFIATLLFAAIPGPAVMYTAAQTLARGRRAGFLTVLGIHTGCYVHVLGATLGLSAMLVHLPVVYSALKIAGALYLVWIGVGIILSKNASELPQVKTKSTRRAFIDSAIVEILNPKAALFFIAFLPQFVDAKAMFPVWVQLLMLGVIVNIFFSVADVITVLVTSMVMSKLQKSNYTERVLRILGGSFLVGLGLKLVTDKN